jgi:hypothetical protein
MAGLSRSMVLPAGLGPTTHNRLDSVDAHSGLVPLRSPTVVGCWDLARCSGVLQRDPTFAGSRHGNGITR